MSGDSGVDVFFVLSGFLIAFILLKEQKKTGSIDVIQFYIGRYLRLAPVLIVWAIFNFIWVLADPKIDNTPAELNKPENYFSTYQAWGFLWTMSFTNNWTGQGLQAWSLAVEFQFYLVSPLVVYAMIRAGKTSQAWLVCLTLVLLCMYIRFMQTWSICPELFNSTYTPKENSTCALKLPLKVYTQTWTRMAPYVTGMYAAYIHVHDSNHDFME
jgi:peptidoglycan/LPS O-acetylase OafA/YrhL